VVIEKLLSHLNEKAPSAEASLCMANYQSRGDQVLVFFSATHLPD